MSTLSESNLPLLPDRPANDGWGSPVAVWQRVSMAVAGTGPDRMSPVRLASHIAVLLVAVLAVLLSRVHLPDLELSPAIYQPRTNGQERLDRRFETAGNATAILPGQDALSRPVVPFTVVAERTRTTIVTYTVQAGDTVYGIAQAFKLHPNTVLWSNGKLQDNPDRLQLDQQLLILPVDGLLHTVVSGDTLDKIAQKYKVQASAILDFAWNQLADNPTLTVGRQLIVPGGTKPYVPPPVASTTTQRTAATTRTAPSDATTGSGSFVWPLSGTITQAYWSSHRALDIAARSGTTVRAADSGYVSVAGWSNGGYGNYVIIDHGNGFQTLYAHFSRILVEAGQSVSKGDPVGEVGSTGRSTGPHLHLEIRRNGVQLNPYNYLP